MSKIFKALKKRYKLSRKKAKYTNIKVVPSNESIVPAVVSNEANKQENDDNNSNYSLEKLLKKIRTYLEKANNAIYLAYENNIEEELNICLSKSEEELMCIQNEVETIENNIASLTNQIKAVEEKKDNFKKNLEHLKTEEKQLRFQLTNLEKQAVNGQKVTNSFNIQSNYPIIPKELDLSCYHKTIDGYIYIPRFEKKQKQRFREHPIIKRDISYQENGITLYLHAINEPKTRKNVKFDMQKSNDKKNSHLKGKLSLNNSNCSLDDID